MIFIFKVRVTVAAFMAGIAARDGMPGSSSNASIRAVSLLNLESDGLTRPQRTIKQFSFSEMLRSTDIDHDAGFHNRVRSKRDPADEVEFE